MQFFFSLFEVKEVSFIVRYKVKRFAMDATERLKICCFLQRKKECLNFQSYFIGVP